MKKSLLLLIAICSLRFPDECGSSSPPPPPPIADFSIAVSPTSVSMQVGGTTLPVTVSLYPQNGFTGPVTVSMSGAPNGINPLPAAQFMLTSGTPSR